MSTEASFLQRIMQSLSRAFERSAQARTRRYLLGQSDRALADMGFSRELLEQGAKAWPWRLTDDTQGEFRLAAATAQDKDADSDRRNAFKAIQFNRRHSDAKLAA